MSTLRVNTLANQGGTQSTAIENAINGSAKAWVNFDGTGTVAIRTSYNVSSITDNGTGLFGINFINAMPDADYVIVGGCNRENNSNSPGVCGIRRDTASTTTVANVSTSDDSGTTIDNQKTHFAIFR